MENLKKTYFEWKDKQKAKAEEFYADPFTGEVSAEDLITCKHKYLIGGSVDSALMGKNKWADKQTVYDDMLNFKNNEDKFVFDRGHALEQFVADQFTKQTHIKHKDGIDVYSDSHPWAYAQIDRLCEDGTPLEIKTAGFKADNGEVEWGRGCDFNEKGDLLHADSKIPDAYWCQCQKQLWLTDKPYMWLCAWILSDIRVRTYRIERDNDFIEKLKDAEIDFMFNHVIPQIPYEDEIEPLETVDEAPDCAYADDTFLTLCRQYKEQSKIKNNADKAQKEIGEQIKALMGEHKQAVNDKGETVCKLTPQSRLTLDSKGLSNKYPEQFKEFYRPVEIAPKLTISKEV